MYEALSAGDIRIYKSIVIEFFLRLEIHNIGSLHVFQDGSSMVNYETLAVPC